MTRVCRNRVPLTPQIVSQQSRAIELFRLRGLAPETPLRAERRRRKERTGFGPLSRAKHYPIRWRYVDFALICILICAGQLPPDCGIGQF